LGYFYNGDFYFLDVVLWETQKMKAFQCFVEMEGIQTRRDGSIKIILGTQELSPENALQLLELRNKQVYSAFLETPVKLEDVEVPKQEPEFNEKTPCQRLRSVLFIWWKQQFPDMEWESFYRNKMELYIDAIKGFLNE